jgi:hypothetical protein
MTVNKYITLANSSDTLSKKFKAIGMKYPENRTDNMDYAADGSPDKAAGPIIRQFIYVLRVPQDVQTNGYGCFDDLQTLWRLNKPNAVPSDIIHLTDHYGNEFDCFFVEGFDPEPLTTMLEGTNAWHIVQVTLQYIRDHESESS